MTGAPASFELDAGIDELRAAAERFAGRVLAPAVRQSELAGRWSQDVLAVLRGFSVSTIDLPAELGGDGVGCLAKVVVLEALARGDAGGLPAADQPGAASGALLACPDGRVREAVAASCLDGTAAAVLVAGAGTGRVEWAPGWPPLRWIWVSDGARLRLVEASAVPEPVAALAFHASGGVTVTLDGAQVRGEWDVGRDGGIGLRGRARLWGAAVAIGVAGAALDATIAYTTERVVFGKPVAHHQGNAFQLAGLAAQVHAARLAVRDAAASYDGGDPHAGFWATQAWMAAIDTAAAVTDAGIQLLGGHGFLVDHPAEKRFREARMLGLLAGGRDAALDDLAASVLDVPDPVFPEARP